MSHRLSDYVYILLTMGLTVYGQLILKWRMAKFGPMPEQTAAKINHLLVLVFDPYIFSMFVASFLAALAWMAALTKFDLGYAYPITSLNFVIVVLLSAWVLAEPISAQKIIGVLLIVVGTAIASRA